jgi:anti-anti-sigma factor
MNPEPSRSTQTQVSRSDRPTDESLSVAVESQDATMIVILSGAAGLMGQGPLDAMVRRVVEEQPRLVIFDLTALRFITSVGVSALIQVRRELREHGGRVVIAGAQGYVADVLATLKILDVIPSYPSTLEALSTHVSAPRA